MTKQDYELIADVIRANAPLSSRGRLTCSFAAKLKDDNPRFNPILFAMRACNMDDRLATRMIVIHDIPVSNTDLLQVNRS